MTSFAEAGGRPQGFNSELSQAAMERVFAERRRQVKLGRSGSIPYACEDPRTADTYRLGVLGEEFGEVCTAIIERQGTERELEEYIHTAAVALACAEGMLRKIGVTIDDSGMEEVDETVSSANFINIDALADRHHEVLLECRRIYEERSARRGPLWRKMGARGQLVNMRTCVERLWTRFFNISPEEIADNENFDVDDALDLINYTVFLVLCLRDGSRDGEWEW